MFACAIGAHANQTEYWDDPRGSHIRDRHGVCSLNRQSGVLRVSIQKKGIVREIQGHSPSFIFLQYIPEKENAFQGISIPILPQDILIQFNTAMRHK